MTERIVAGDCVAELAKLDAGSARLVFADPPYNIGIDYGNGTKADRLPDADYLAWCEQWMRAAVRVLTPDGSLWALISDDYAGEFAVTLKRLGLTLRNWITWHETFGANCTRKFNRCSRHLLYYTKHPRRFVFNADAPEIRRWSDRQAKYADRRANPAGKLLDDVWSIPRVAGTHGERVRGVPTQLPLALLRRVVAVASDPGDLIVDPFAGSGTSGVAAAEAGRRFVGVELNPAYAEIARHRLAATVGEKSGGPT